MAARVACVALALALPTVEAFVAPAPFMGSARAPTRASTRGFVSMENFGLPVGEDQAENVPRAILGEANYRSFVKSYNPDGLLVGGARYPLFKRIAELKLLSATAESGLLTRLEQLGLKLSDLEKILPIVEELELLALAEKNQDLILKTLLPLAVENAPLLLPVLSLTLKTPPGVFFGVALAAFGAEAGLIFAQDNVALDVLAGLLLVPLGAISLVGGTILSSGISIPAPPKKAVPVAAKKPAGPLAALPIPSAAGSGRPKVTVAAKPAPKPVAAAPKPAPVKPAPKKVLGPLAPAPRTTTPGAVTAIPTAVKKFAQAAPAPKATLPAKPAAAVSKAASTVKGAGVAAKSAAKSVAAFGPAKVQQPINAAKAAAQKPVAAAKSAVQKPAAAAKSAFQKPAASFQSAAQKPAAAAKAVFQKPAAAAQSAAQKPVAAAKATFQKPIAAAQSAAQKPATAAKAAFQKPAAAVQSAAQKPAAAAKTAFQKPAAAVQSAAQKVTPPKAAPPKVSATPIKAAINPARPAAAPVKTSQPIKAAADAAKSAATAVKKEAPKAAAAAKAQTPAPVKSAVATVQKEAPKAANAAASALKKGSPVKVTAGKK